MDFILALILIFLEILFEVVVTGLFIGLYALLRFLAMCLEFVYLAVTKGPFAASEQFQKRKQERSEWKREQDEKKRAAQAARAAEKPTINGQQTAILVTLTVLIMIGGVVTWIVMDRNQQQRIAVTRSQVKQLANKFAGQIQDKEITDPISGRLRDRDAWQQPIDLRVDKGLLSSQVVVRSWGPDRKPGSFDDIVTERTIRASAKEVGGKLAKRSIKSVRDRIAGWLPGGDKEEQPEETDRVEE